MNTEISEDLFSDDLENVYQTLARHIRADDGQCVLILGPELSVNKSGEGYKSYFKELKKNQSLGIDEYFESENLFAFVDDGGFDKTRRAVSDFYAGCGDPLLIEMITRIRFPLIINLCPDIALNNAYKQKGIPFTKAYFSKDAYLRFKNLPFPTKDNPIIYNIFGSIENDPSLILTHSKLYETIEYLLPKNSLPEEIESFLKLANSFILLGVRFDSWYYQLVCHKLGLRQDNNLKTNLSTYYRNQPLSVGEALKKNFGLQFTPGNPVQALEQIITACDNSSDALRLDSEQNVYSLYVSYAWKDAAETADKVNRETPVDYLEKFSALTAEKQLHFYRDHKDLDYGDSIESFMTRIGKGKTVIRVVSDKYLKSLYCMVESMMMDKYREDKKRVFTILLDDARLEEEASYKQYWAQRLHDLLENLEVKFEDDHYDYYGQVYRYILRFIAELRDTINLRVSLADFSLDDTAAVTLSADLQPRMDDFVQSVLTKLKEK